MYVCIYIYIYIYWFGGEEREGGKDKNRLFNFAVKIGACAALLSFIDYSHGSENLTIREQLNPIESNPLIIIHIQYILKIYKSVIFI